MGKARKETRTFEQLKEQYDIEKELANRLREASKEESIYIQHFMMSCLVEYPIIPK